MLSLTYSSTARDTFSEADLPRLLLQCRDNNARLGLTGMLLYRDGHFLQLLEGEDDAVRDRINIITHDPRHQRVATLLEESIPTRQFPDWTMGYAAVTSDTIDTVPGYRSTFDDLASESVEAGSSLAAVRELIRWFRTQPTGLV